MCYSLQGRKPQRKGIYLMHFIESCVVFSSRWEQRGLGGRELKPVPLLTSATRKALKARKGKQLLRGRYPVLLSSPQRRKASPGPCMCRLPWVRASQRTAGLWCALTFQEKAESSVLSILAQHRERLRADLFLQKQQEHPVLISTASCPHPPFDLFTLSFSTKSLQHIQQG